MNVVISGPFGRGSLADEAILAGLLKHLKPPKNSVTVLSANPDNTRALHNVDAITVGEPGGILSNKAVWSAFEKAHLFVLAGAGIINARGKIPARVWLGQLEHAQTAGLQTAVVGIGAEKIGEARDRARVQRLLHHCAGGISARDESSKLALIGYGLNANRISNNGDPVLALAPSGDLAQPDDAQPRIGIVLAASVPSRTEFAFDPPEKCDATIAFARALITALLAGGAGAVRLFHDDTDAAGETAEVLQEIAPAKISAAAADRPLAEIQVELAQCHAVFSFSLHGLKLAAASGAPAAGMKTETGAAEFLNAAGLGDGLVDASDPALAAKAVLALGVLSAERRAKMKNRMSMLKRKEAQNARMMELLVPRRVARDRMDIGERVGKRKFGCKRAPRENTDDVDFPD